MFGLIKKIFIRLLTGLVNGSNHTMCVCLSNHKWMNQPTFTNLHPNEYSQEFHYYPFVVKLDGSVGSCNTFNDFSNKACVPNKTEDLKSMCIQQDQSIYCLSVNVNLMEENVSQINGGITINAAECKQCHVCEKYCVWNSATCSCENGKYLASIMDDSAIICDEFIDVKEMNFDENK